MANRITKLYTELSDENLKDAIREMKEDERMGLIRQDGWVRRMTNQVSEITGESYSTLLFLTQNNLYREAAHRFVN